MRHLKQFKLACLITSITFSTSLIAPYSIHAQVFVPITQSLINPIVFTASNNISIVAPLANGLRQGEPGSFVTAYAYNSDQLKISEVFPRGNGIKYVYDELNADPRGRGNLLEVRRKTNMAGADDNNADIVVSMTYELQFNQVKTMTDAKGEVTTFTYDYELPTADPDYGTKGNLVKVEGPQVTGSGVPLTDFSYNSFGQVTRMADPNGNVTTYDYFPVTGYLQRINRDPAGINAVTEFTYDSFGNVASVKDAENRTIDYDYDELGWLRRVTNALNYQTNYFHTCLSVKN